MTTDELRKICVDYIKLSVSFQWVCDRYMSLKENPERTFYKGKLYGGIPYINTASGSLYRILEYYNDENGELDASYLSQNPLLFGTACSGTASIALSRVVNSANLSWTSHMNSANGFIPVGPYRYDYSKSVIWEKGADGKRFYHYNTKNVCKENGEQVMFESYALSRPADCYSCNGHVRLASADPKVVRKEDGTIDGEQSTIELAEQGLYTKAAYHNRKTSKGTAYNIRGNDGRPFTFQELFDSGYLVHTFREFLGIKAVDRAEAEIQRNSEEAAPWEGVLKANYPISDVFTSVKNETGEEVFRYVHRLHPHFIKEISTEECLPTERLKNSSLKGCSAEIQVQLYNGEKMTVYQGALA